MTGQQRIACSLLVLGLSLLCQPAVTKDAECKRKAECYYDCGHVVMDMTALKNHTFKDVTDKLGQNRFSYSPCGTFTEGKGCVETHVCQITDFTAGAPTIDVGSKETVVLSPSGGPSYLQYSHTTPDGIKRWTSVTVKCASHNDILSSNPQLTVEGEDPSNHRHYRMTLTSTHACFQIKGQTTTPKPATTTKAPNVTTAGTTAHHGNATTPGHNVTTPASHNVTTPASHNATTASHNVTTPSHNVTTPSHNVTTPSHNVTTPSHNVTTPGNMTTHAMTTAEKNATTTVHVPTSNLTTPGHGTHTTHGQMTTHPTSAAAKSRQTAVLALLMPAVIALACR